MIAFAFMWTSLSWSQGAQFHGDGRWSEADPRRRFDQALVKLQQGAFIAPRNATIENLLGITETQLGHIDEAAGTIAMRTGLTPRKPRRTGIHPASIC